MTMMKRAVKPVGFRVLVKLRKVAQEEYVTSEAGVITEVRSKSRIEREQRATQEAYVVECGPSAFKAFDDGKAWCSVGDCVLISKYSGDDLDDIEEGELYRVINDRDIEAVFPNDKIGGK